QELQGSYALAMIDQKEADKLYIAKNKSPLLVGVGVGFHVICSDALAMLDVTQEFVEILDGEMAEITRNTLELTRLDGEKIVRASRHLEVSPMEMEKGTYPHYMLKEIEEQQ